MIFEEWQATKRRVTVADEALDSYCYGEDTEECLVYAGGLIIECLPNGNYYLCLDRDQWEDERLEPLERRLYQFGLDEGLMP